MRKRKTIIDILLSQKTIAVDYSATRLTVATQETFTFYNYIYVNMSTQQPMQWCSNLQVCEYRKEA